MTGKFKTGDKVKAIGKWAGTYVIDRVEKDGYLLRGIGPANGFYLEDEDLVAANSTTNPIVQNAIAAKRKGQ